MYYEPVKGHGLRHNPFNALVAPRPIAWVSTQDAGGRANLAPYSFFNGVAYDPPMVMFANTATKPDRERGKDSLGNIRETGEFAVNLVSYALRDAMNVSSEHYPREVDEFEAAGLARAPCHAIACPRVAAAPATLECRLVQITRLPGETNYAVFGEVVGVHIADEMLVDGMVDVTRVQLLARLGYRDYTRVTEAFTLARPDD